ncbi:MAG TPA: type I-U CRISPR-associated helicase/endonuclease Cas3 [Bryobacteraceae bacterium]|nr:type I-U CRISPR-associated helicase/endonuclease Cas3 [Bryobacteraceae bacterium]
MVQTDSVDFFRKSYRALTGKTEPFPWQEELFVRFCRQDIPKDVVLPTGCGKTSAMVSWLLALAWQSRGGAESVTLPRRLLWVVNRRVVVDQATDEAVGLKERLNNRSLIDLEAVRLGLGELCAEGIDDLLSVSTLRGQYADNGEWRDYPERPAIVVGTVDMIGSRLLFSGYGRGFRARPLHAGFIGQDSLLVHDEAHLEPAFQCLIQAVEAEQQRCGESRQFRTIALTATSRTAAANPFVLSEADRSHAEIRRRIEASKGIGLHTVDTEKKLAAAIYELALGFKDSGQAILIFLRKVEDVLDVKGKLEKQGLRVYPLTGTMRGLERDQMAKNNRIFARFARDKGVEPQEGTVYLVCTSAGEVGVNLSADHLICDLVPFDSMTQRFGRVNRFGGGEARIEIVPVIAEAGQATAKGSPGELEYNRRRELTLALLERLPPRPDGRYDASPLALEGLPAEERIAAFTPPPTILPTSGILFDAWALTSVRGPMPGRPPVADWLHGITEWEPPQTFVAWREEVERITTDLARKNDPEDLLEDYPLEPHELLRDNSRRVLEHLQKIAERSPGLAAWLIDSAGNVKAGNLAELVSPDQPKRNLDLGDCTVLLPPSAGGLTTDGMLDGSAAFSETRGDYDVADLWLDESGRAKRQRRLNQEEAPEGMRLVRVIELGSGSEEEEDEPAGEIWRWYERTAGSERARREQDWEVHTEWAERIAGDLVAKLGLPDPEASAIVFAAKWHDLGKRRELWQRSIGNDRYRERTLAKSGPRAKCFPCGYRHELGSMIDVSRMSEFLRLTAEMQDLVLHVIGAHHGRARPHFPADEVFDPECGSGTTDGVGRETPRRFARLQRKYGRWGLAYLESLVRAADALASQRFEPAPVEGRDPNRAAIGAEV